MPAGPATPEPANHPAFTTTNTAPQGQPPVMAGGMLAPETQPRIPAKSPMRRSGDMSREITRETYPPREALPGDNGPVSPVDSSYARHDDPASPSRANFSYPSRSSLKTSDQPMRHNQNAINDLRAAAKGLHVSYYGSREDIPPTHTNICFRELARPYEARSIRRSTDASQSRIPRKQP